MKNFSYKDISKLANVSVSTISRYYNGGYVSKATRAKIEEIVKQYDYYPNHGARLIKGRDSSIFVIAPEWYENAYTQIMNGIEQGAKRDGRKVVITHSENLIDSYIETIKYVVSWKPMAIVMFLPDDPNNEICKFVKDNCQDTITLIYGREYPGLNWIRIDYENSFFSLTNRFKKHVEKNQKIIFALDGKLSEKQKYLRASGFERAAKALKLDFEIYPLRNKDPKHVYKFLSYLRQNNLTHVVCSTHEVFINLISSGDRNLKLTDIGGLSIYDYQSRYKAKIFIDYPAIGLEINNIINKSSKTNLTNGVVNKPNVLYK